MKNSPLYAAIDLGSNSFHMLVVREVAGSIRVVAKVKRKVRLAEGLSSSNEISGAAMERGWNCLRLFAEQLKDIPSENVRIVATATLRLANNSAQFIARASQILSQPIQIISGEDEARLIYQGVCHTSAHGDRNLVIDIGGASTELIIGEQQQILQLNSLNLGCVTWLNRYFSDGMLTEQAFDDACNGAQQVISEIASSYRRCGWQECCGASGTVQAIQEALQAQGETEQISLDKLLKLKQQVLACGSLDALQIQGLAAERLKVFPSGLAILIALFEVLGIESMHLAGGALREGLIHSMLGGEQPKPVHERTIDSLFERYQLDREQGERVARTALKGLSSLKEDWGFDEDVIRLLASACKLHEIGLCIEYKKAPQHAAYLIENLSLPGFTTPQRQLISGLLFNQRDSISLDRLQLQRSVPQNIALRMLRLLRLSIILCMRRANGSIPDFELMAEGEVLTLTLPAGWMEEHYLRASELLDEIRHQQQAGWELRVVERSE
ncbi:guanosine-5'-triphosphate,3'-diphosphate diphosphatase [Dongshaea marina]|uniref:guanosine-5'-triphosphate,3'-diphosphate diphosphatase n=1 Tax=Dongshaea marina TaxID=2047966 RepID=UPI000D3E5A5B|nr:guanosine-5'-triphosphate,3'-diphosphate diphosphatase [Dongshaea marina]